MLSNTEWTIKHCYMQQLLSCANLHITLFPQIIIILCQQPLYSCSLFLRLASFTRNTAYTNNALGVRKRSCTRHTQNRGSLFLVHFFSCLCFFLRGITMQQERFSWNRIKKSLIITSLSGTDHSSGLCSSHIFIPVLTPRQSGSYVCISLGAVSALTLYSTFPLRTISFDFLQIKNPLVVILSHFQLLLNN